jgi:hypothetical protein
VLYRARRADRPGQLPGLHAQEIRRAARLDYGSTDTILEKLEQDGLVIRTRQVVSGDAARFRRDDLWVFAADASVVTVERVFRLFAFDARHVADVALDREDPLARFVRDQRLANADASLASVFDDPPAR